MPFRNQSNTRNNRLYIVLGLLAVFSVVMLLYRSAQHRGLPDNEWIDFEEAAALG